MSQHSMSDSPSSSSASDSDFSDAGDSFNKRKGLREEDSFDGFDDSYAESTGKGNQRQNERGKIISNMPHDEAIDLSESDSLGTSIDTNDAGSPVKPRPLSSNEGTSANMKPSFDNSLSGSDDSRSGIQEKSSSGTEKITEERERASSKINSLNRDENADTDMSDSESSASSDTDISREGIQGNARAAPVIQKVSAASTSQGDSANEAMGQYNADEFINLRVSAEVRELFQYIGRYKPHNIDLETKLKCFVPEYIPAVGEIDAFIKVAKPTDENLSEALGLSVLDEPSSNQSDPTVLDLQLRAISKKSNLEPMVVRSIEEASKHSVQIDKWIESIEELHRTKPPPQVNYTKSMPDIESLMQVWPDSFEKLLGQINLPSAEMDLDIQDYARVVCALMDIPVHKNVVESLHVLFTVYSEFKNSQHFGFMNQSGMPQAVPLEQHK